MRRILCIVSLCVVALAGTEAFAIRTDGGTIVIPVVMHGDGALGTKWRTDVWLASRGSASLTCTLTFYPNGGSTQTATVPVPPWNVVHLPDIVLTTFGLSDAKGLLVVTESGGLSVMASARIYNTGSAAGEYGQFVPGFALSQLARQGYVAGLSGASGNRTNIGVANPTDTAFDKMVSVYDASGTEIYSGSVHVGAHAVVQIDDIFTTFGIPQQDNVAVNLEAGLNEQVVYAYASVVRNDTGDAYFVWGTAPNTGP